MGKFMKHTNYSDYIIFEEVETGTYDNIKEAFQKAADRLGCRIGQVSGQYYKLRNEGITLADIDYSKEDVDNYDPGGSDKIERTRPNVTRSKSPNGYGEPWKKHQEQAKENFLAEEDDIIIPLHTPSDEIIEEASKKLRSVYDFEEGKKHIIEKTILQLLEDTDPAFKFKIAQLIMKDIQF